MKSHLILAFILIGLAYGCPKEKLCPSREDLGVLELTSETRTYLPERYFSETASIEFESTEGKITKFDLDGISYAEYGPLTTHIPCKYDSFQIVKVSYEYEENYHVYYSIDSLKLILINKVGTTEKGYYDLLNIWLSKEEGSISVYGQINIITDIRTVVDDTIIKNPVSFTYYDSIEIGGQVFKEVFGDRNPNGRMSDVYWKQHEGLIGFKDKEGIEWMLKK